MKKILNCMNLAWCKVWSSADYVLELRARRWTSVSGEWLQDPCTQGYVNIVINLVV